MQIGIARSDFVLGDQLHGETMVGSSEARSTKNEEHLLSIPDYVECVIRRRLNRFVVEVDLSGRTEHAHINNTGRLLELLVEGRKAACLPTRGGKTAYRLFAIDEKAGWALIDTQFQMRAFEQAVEQGRIPWLSGWQIQRRNPRLGESVLDYLFRDEKGSGELYVEVKSAVLRDVSYAMYPDCPTLRGQRHIKTLIDHARRGQRGAICFMAAFKGAIAFRPYVTGDPVVATLLEEARVQGVGLRAVSLYFDGKGIRLDDPDLSVITP
jgi:sugar fermentation stimulation protein A